MKKITNTTNSNIPIIAFKFLLNNSPIMHNIKDIAEITIKAFSKKSNLLLQYKSSLILYYFSVFLIFL